VGGSIRSVAVVSACALALFATPAALADDWLPHPSDATWTYEWSDTAYATTPTKEKVTVKEQSGRSFVLAWTTVDQGNATGAATSVGTVSFQESTGGLVNTDWSSNPPPPDIPVLCPQIGGCNNSLASTFYLLIWGSRGPVLAEPLLAGTSWSGTGGGSNDVASTNAYAGTEQITVPAFKTPVTAFKIRSEITQAGALGDPYGSGVRTVWWVYGVGPVKIRFDHAGGSDAPTTTAVLDATNQTPKAAPADANYFPLVKGAKATYRWTNAQHLTKPVVQSFTCDDVVNASARFSVKTISGPIRAAGAYGFTLRTDGLTNIWTFTKAASLAKLPPLGPAALPADKRRRFLTPFDLMIFGFNPVLPAYPADGASWGSKSAGRDFEIYGVNGYSKVLGVQTVTVPMGTFKALAVQSALTQPGFKFGSGTRTAWFVAGTGLVKLVWRHRDGSVSTVVKLK
jgi:hypothetical protein